MSRSAQPYDDAFYLSDDGASLQSARVVVPMLMSLVQPKTVIDVGCGLGGWLKAFQEHGVERVRGIDGPWVDPARLLIDFEDFQPMDLRTPAVRFDERYDLALCLEVTEHLPYRSGTRLVRMLTQMSPVIVFSAAIPGQGGTAHINEQWPRVWESEFKRYDFVRLDPIRPRVLQDRRVAFWYRQNLYVYAARDLITRSPLLRAEQHEPKWDSLEIIGTYILDDLVRRQDSLRGILSAIPRVAKRALQRRLSRLLHRDNAEGLRAHGREPAVKAEDGPPRVLAGPVDDRD